jgi:hypothetical protein
MGHPRLWPVALRQLRRLRPDGSVFAGPDRRWMAFRSEAQYGATGGRARQPEPGDVIAWLSWCQSIDGLVKARSLASGHQ